MRHPDGSIPCNRCHTDMVVVDDRYACDCDVRRLALTAPDEANRLRQAITLLRGQSAICDRCQREEAFRLVQCYEGCRHAQCVSCAEATRGEATTGTLGGGTFGGRTFGGNR